MFPRKFFRVLLACVAMPVLFTRGQAQPAQALTVGEGWVEPLGFHQEVPTFSWKLPPGVRRQQAYQIELRAGAVRWDSGWVESEQTHFIPYGGPALGSRTAARWRVRWRNEAGRASRWSRWATFELGLLRHEDWQAQWIRPSQAKPTEGEPVGTMRRGFRVGKGIAAARVHVTARGVFDLQLNDRRVGDEYFANGWTSYAHRLDARTYDVTDLLRRGDNRFVARIGHGWYAGRMGWKKEGLTRYGVDPELLLQLEIRYRDGSTETIVSDGQWEGTWAGPIVSSSIYDGEDYDARRAAEGWAPVQAAAELGEAKIGPKPFEPVRATRVIGAKSVSSPSGGGIVFDLGQNIVGWARLRIPVQAGRTVTIRFAEMLQADGTLYTANYRSAKSTDRYTPAKDGVVTWEPSFTFHGFRYVELQGLPEGVSPRLEWVEGVVLHSALRPAGAFTSSHAKLNQLQSNIVWGLRGNFLDIPTDCPQRDERMGWTGDAQVFCPTSMFNYDALAFWKSWLGSMRHDQLADGRIPHVVPDILRDAGSPGWMDAATIIPWDLYVRTGDVSVLSDNFAMMEKLVGWYRSKGVNGLPAGVRGFGDWLQPYAAQTRGDTPQDLLAAVFYARSVQILARTAEVLGRTDEAARYTAEAADVAKAFAERYLDASGRLLGEAETQTGYVLALAFELVPENVKPTAVEHLVRLIGEAGGHLRTGFLGTPHLCSVLAENGQGALAYELLFRETYPGWFFTIDQGATTMWERWNSYSHEKGFGDAGMNSFNHYAYGAIGQWMYERVAGLAPDPAAPGYRHFFVRPLIGAPLENARAELETPHGLAVSSWRKVGDRVEMEVVVPPNTTATVELPDGRPAVTVTPGKHRFESAWR